MSFLYILNGTFFGCDDESVDKDEAAFSIDGLKRLALLLFESDLFRFFFLLSSSRPDANSDTSLTFFNNPLLMKRKRFIKKINKNLKTKN
jgi:hypothetical protein